MKLSLSSKLKLTAIVILNLLGFAALSYMFVDLLFVGGPLTILKISLVVALHLFAICFGLIKDIGNANLILVSSVIFFLLTLTIMTSWLDSYRNILLFIGKRLDLLQYPTPLSVINLIGYSSWVTFVLMMIVDIAILYKGIVLIKKLKG